MAEKNASHMQQTPARPSQNGQSDQELGQIEARLEHLRDLNENWDTYGGLPPSKTAIDRARQLLGAVTTTVNARPGCSSLPTVIAPTSNGGILLEWCAEHTDLEVEIGEMGRLHCLQIRHNADGEQHDEHDDLTVPDVVNLVASTIGT